MAGLLGVVTSTYTAQCMCGQPLTGATRDEQLAAARAHMATTHPQLDLSDTQLRNFLERVDQLGPVEPRIEGQIDVTVVDLTADRIDDVLTFFDGDAFADNGAWASCYCMAYHVAGGELSAEWKVRTWERNRADLARRIDAGSTTGTLAYDGDRLVGWCNASTRASYPDQSTGVDDDRVGVVACFVIAIPYRGHGVASKLLDAAVAQFARRGLAAVEAFPVVDPKSEASAFRGPMAMYLAAGFVPVGPGDPPEQRVRLTL
jgi:GNAT superfamily N-acetyltransferase